MRQRPPNYARAGASPLSGHTILQVVPELDAGGAERTAIDIAAGLAAVGARGLVASQGGRLVGELQAKGGIAVPLPVKTKNPLKMLLNIGRLVTVCRNEGVTLIHARSRAPAWSALAAARILGIPYVTTYHGSYSGRSAPKVFYNSVMARGDIVIANSYYTADLIRSAHQTEPQRLRVIHRGTDLQQFTPAAVAHERIDRLRRAWAVKPHQRIILLAARLTRWKGQIVLIEAMKRLKDNGFDDVVVVLAGDPQGREGYVREIDALIARLGLQDQVLRVGHCSDMPAAFMAASVVTVPSIEPEAFGRSAVEAQAMGTPVVVSELGAVPETVLAPPDVSARQRSGWRVPPDNAEALSHALTEALLLGASGRDALAGRARRHVEQHFSLDRMVGDTLAVYAELLQLGR